MQAQLESSADILNLAGHPIGRGGEAVIYAARGPRGFPPLVAKVYHRPTTDHAAKFSAMIARPPEDPMTGHGHTSITWPLDRLLMVGSLGSVVGYVMPRIDKALPVAEFFNPKARLSHCPLFHFNYLLRCAHNLSAAVRAIHEAGYVIGDLNEANCLVNNQALVTLVDTDSFQVPAPGRIFRCPVGKPEYTAPELQGVRFADVDRSPEHDNFALAVLIFQLLMQGIHPFAGKFTGSGDPADLPGRIAAGHWPYGPPDRIPYAPNPHAPPLEVLPAPVRSLLHQCFEAGHPEPTTRPGAKDWQEALQEGEKELVHCPANAQHLYPRILSSCPWCELTRKQGRDPFPSAADVRAGTFGLGRLVAKLRKSVPIISRRPATAPLSSPVAAAPRYTPNLRTPSLLPSTALGPLHPPEPVSPHLFASWGLFAGFVAAVGGALSAVMVAVIAAPWQRHPLSEPPHTQPLFPMFLGTLIGLMCGWVIGGLFDQTDAHAPPERLIPPATGGIVVGILAGSFGGWWGHLAGSMDPQVVAGSLGQQLGAIGLAFTGGGLVGVIGGLTLGMAAGWVAQVSRRTSP